MNGLILLPDRDHLGGDWHGAFRPEALSFQRVHGLPDEALVQIDIGQNEAQRRAQVIEALRWASLEAPLDVVAFFCHAEWDWMQLGFGRSTVEALGAALAMAGRSNLRVVLYACSVAEGTGPAGDGGLADELRDSLCKYPTQEGPAADQCQVDGHTRAGHTTSNPYVRRMAGPAGVGGRYLIEPRSALWASWMRALHDRARNTLRLRYPLMSQADIEAELKKTRP